MLYIAYVKARPDATGIEQLSRKWWNDGARPDGLRTIGIYGCIGTESPDIFVFDADSHEEIQTMVHYWRPVADLQIHPAVDLVAAFRGQGMSVA